MKYIAFLIAITCCFAATPETGFGLTLKIATISPEGSMWMNKMRQGAKVIQDETGGRVKFKFYPGGVMGNDAAVLKKIRIGQLHGGAFSSGSMARFFPGNQVYGQLMKFNSLDEVDYVREKMDPYIITGLEKAGFVTLGMAGGGFAYLMSAKPVLTDDDLLNRKIWIPNDNSTTQEMVKVFGITPIPLALADVRTGLQTGLIDTVANSPAGAIILQWHTQVKYLVDQPFLYLYATLSVSSRAFSKINPGDQKIALSVMANAFKEIQAQSRKDNIKALEALKNQGVTFLTPAKDQIEQWRKKSVESTKALVDKGLLPAEAVQTMDRHLFNFNSQAHASNDT
ncbi:MAG: C4-dicarboxylate ABC transporter [Desulfobacteraceae bacterium]|nr:MAG: C4-dicarboxylate ABC transporter [Desulfobacteraceae bacterium]